MRPAQEFLVYDMFCLNCAQNIMSGETVDTMYRCVHNVYVAHQAGMPRQQDAHGSQAHMHRLHILTRELNLG